MRLAEDNLFAAGVCPLDRRRIALQIRAIRVTLRVEEPRHNPETMEAFRSRARTLLDGLEEAVRPFPDLEDALAEARAEVEGAGASE